jgi:hypothetical protein
MQKEAYYFSHDSNARNDENILKLRIAYGWEGYGLYWALIECLRDANAYRMQCNYEVIAYNLHCSSDLIKAIIKDFGLFTIDGNCFYSQSLKRRMEMRELKSIKARQSAILRWKNEANLCERIPNAMQPQSDSNAIKGKEIKEIKEKVDKKEKKENPATLQIFENVFVSRANCKPYPASTDEVIGAAESIGYAMDARTAENFISRYAAGGWMLSGVPIRDWKQLLTLWKNNEKKDRANGINSKRVSTCEADFPSTNPKI